LWGELGPGDGIRRFDSSEYLMSDTDLRHRDGDLDRHVGGDAETAILMRSLALRVRMRGGDHAANHDQGNTQHTEKNPPRRSPE
jgi:hypothetical protein